MIEQARDAGHDFECEYRLLMPDRSIKYLHAVAQRPEIRTANWSTSAPFRT